MTKKFVGSLAVFTLLGGSLLPQTAFAEPTVRSGMNIDVTGPVSTTTLKEGDTVRITWTSSSTVKKVSILAASCLFCFQGIATHVPNTGSYDWKVAVQSPYDKTQLSFLVIGYNDEGKTVMDEIDTLVPYQPPVNATPVPTSDPDDLSSYDTQLPLDLLAPEFTAFQRTLSRGTMDSWPKAGTNGQVDIEVGTPLMVAFPDPKTFPEVTILFSDDPYVLCRATSKLSDIPNHVWGCRAVGIGRTAVMMFQGTADGTLQLEKEIVFNITKASPTPTPSASSSPTPTKSPTPKPSTSFSDLPDNHSLAPAITKLRDQGVIGGYPDGTFKPEAPINRGEYTKIIIGALTDDVGDGKNCFSDVHEEWFAKYVCYAKEHGIIGGYPDGSFHPERNINYAEAVKIAMLAFDRMEGNEAEGAHWYDKYLTAAKTHGYLDLIAVLSTGDPITPTTRAQTAQLIVNVMGE